MSQILIKDHLEKLCNFKAVIELGSISKAAKMLGISQSSLSHCMMVLEAAASTKLLKRESRAVFSVRSGRQCFNSQLVR